jgi:hypothetical protein
MEAVSGAGNGAEAGAARLRGGDGAALCAHAWETNCCGAKAGPRAIERREGSEEMAAV